MNAKMGWSGIRPLESSITQQSHHRGTLPMQKHGYYQPTTSHALVERKYYKPMHNPTVADTLLEQPFIMCINAERQAVINSSC